jgi:hypothetical protein
MKRILLAITAVISLSSCGGWSSEDREMYTQSCMEDARSWAGSEDKAKTYCNCMLEKLTAKYPDVNDMLEHMDEVTRDTDLIRCKQAIK